MSYEHLDRINSPSDLRALPEENITALIDEVRAFLIDRVGESGGHLASNLGAVELSVAIHRIFDSPTDHIIFDVGHQAYVHKLLTGRREHFDTLRTPGGLSGFTSMRESEHDAFGAGHSSTSVSAALGYAESDRLLGRDSYTVCVIGDGAYTGGMVHEAINNCKPEHKLIIILNENGMSISKNRGAFARYLSGVRTSRGYRGFKQRTIRFLSATPLGKPIAAFLSFVKNSLKRLLFRPNYFEELGMYYIGPVDGNDYKKTARALMLAKENGACTIVHLKTKKGKGHAEAESAPEAFHSVGSEGKRESFHSVMTETLISEAERNKKIVAVTAAMGVGTGLEAFGERYPERYFDVGIAEEHALTFSAGLAAGGLVPAVAIYSTFLQRAYDSIVHDVALQNLPVRIFVDRAGLAVRDGATHHGIFDVSFLGHIPGIEIFSPATYSALRASVKYALCSAGPVAVRYPNAQESASVCERLNTPTGGELSPRSDFDINNPPKCVFVTYGTIAERVLLAEDELREGGCSVGTLLLLRIRPVAEAARIIADLIRRGSRVVFVEEGIRNGGAAMLTEHALLSLGVPLSRGEYRIAAIDDSFAQPSEPCDIYDFVGLSKEKLKRYFLDEHN
ncbi:MAG: 1-deoxy-D-xylulose-5-phosphate synthase [Clostridia bacterium]|nr:1-deoxy-D-xylulose-5-phosphate synthase [Clostridia bacterium]